MYIKKASLNDLEPIMDLYENARRFMREHGNPDQWGTSYPPVNLVKEGIEAGNTYLCIDDIECTIDEEIAAVFFYKEGIDPTYLHISDGQWLNDKPYGVVHRITSTGKVPGTASFCLNWAYNQCKNLKIDTHKDNVAMQKLLAKNGFTYCGIIHTEDDSERLAYQKC